MMWGFTEENEWGAKWQRMGRGRLNEKGLRGYVSEENEGGRA